MVASIETMRDLDLAQAARSIEATMVPALRALAATHPVIGEVRGRGAMIALEIVKPGTTDPDAGMATMISRTCHAAGLLTLTCGTYGNILRFLPPLVMPPETLDRGLAIVAEAFATTGS
jgi:4-aminobutyrate aminotransferase/(S)-3-amino-2-methylpropionate transaminase